MKVTRYLALFLIAVMATTVVSAAGVLTAPKAAAVDQTDQYLPITYTPGAKYTYLPTQFNFHATVFVPGYGPSQHLEVSRGGTATAMVRAEAWQNGVNLAAAGMQWQITNLAGNEDKPVKATLTVTYTLAARGDSRSAADFIVDSYWQDNTKPSFYDAVHGSDPIPVKTATQTFTWTGPLDLFFRYYGSGQGPFGVYGEMVQCVATSNNVPERVTATANAQSITIEFPAS